MTEPLDLDALRVLYEATTQGEWREHEDDDGPGGSRWWWVYGSKEEPIIFDYLGKGDAAFCAAVHNQFPALLDQLRTVETARDAAQKALRQIQQWCEAYPVDMFPPLSAGEAQFAGSVLREAGISMEALHAGWARHLLTGIGGIAAAVLAKEQA